MTSFSTVSHVLASFLSSVNGGKKRLKQKLKLLFSGWFCAQETSQSQESITHLPWVAHSACVKSRHVRMNWKRAAAERKCKQWAKKCRRLFQQLISPQTIANIKDLHWSNGKSIHLKSVRCKEGATASENTDASSWEGMNGEISEKKWCAEPPSKVEIQIFWP